MTNTAILGMILLGATFAVLIALVWLLVWTLGRVVPALASLAGSAWVGMREDPQILKLRQRYPGFARFLVRRFDKSRFDGLALTILGGIFAYFLLLFLSSILEFALSDPALLADNRLANLFYAFRDPELVEVFTFITGFGSAKIVVLLLVVISALLLIWRKGVFLPGLWLSVIGSEAMTWGLKNAFNRPRPDLAVYVEHSGSFPSGHATAAVALYGFAAYLLVRLRLMRVIPAVFGFVLMAFLVGFSRLYLIEHYLSDVLNGYMVGAVWVALAVLATEWLCNNRTVSKNTAVRGHSARRALTLVGLMFVAGLAGWMALTQNMPTNVTTSAAQKPLDTPLERAFGQGILAPFTETLSGSRQEPVTLVILASGDSAFAQGFQRAGWTIADRAGFISLASALYAAWFNREYDAAPVTPSFWMGRPNGFAFQKSTSAESLRQRHHVRFWNTGYHNAAGLTVYVGTASFDDGLKWGLTHHIAPNIDTERDGLRADLVKGGAVETGTFQLIAPVLGTNFNGDPFFTDGKAFVLRF